MRVPRFILAASAVALLAGCYGIGPGPISPHAGPCGHDRARELAPVIEAVTISSMTVAKGGTARFEAKTQRRDTEFRLVHLGYKWTEYGPTGEGITYNLGSEYAAATTWKPRNPGRRRIVLEVNGAYTSSAHIWATVAEDGSARFDGPAIVYEPGECANWFPLDEPASASPSPSASPSVSPTLSPG